MYYENYRYMYILCEGYSEESFIKRVLCPYLERKGVFVTPIVLGGVSHYEKIRNELIRLGKNKSVYLSTMLDYYKLPKDVPGVKNSREKSAYNPSKIAEYIEEKIAEDLEKELVCKKFIPNIIMHEYEALLFSDIDCFKKCQGITKKAMEELRREVSGFLSPEYVNNSEQTAPSKRILRVYDRYQKVVDGTMIAEKMGIEKMLDKCEHFATWIRKIQDVAE